MGGDAAPDEVAELATFAKKRYDLKTAWYSGKAHLPKNFDADAFDFVKLGPYVEKFGGLKSRTTNQHFYRIEKGEMRDITEKFWK